MRAAIFGQLACARKLGCALMAGACIALAAPASFAGELGINVFGLSLHTDRSGDYNEINQGLGLHYVFVRPHPEWELFADSSVYYDSQRHWAKYIAAGAHYRFTQRWKAGLALTYVQSRSYNDGKPLLAPVPTLAVDFRRVVLNFVLLPSETASSKTTGIAFFLTIPLRRSE